MSELRFSIGLPPNLSFAEYGEFATLVERYDFSHLVIDDIPNFASCWGILFHLARHTTRVQLGPSVTHPYQRHPMVTAANAAALDDLSEGRAFLGLGRGDANDHRAMHIPMPRPLRALREAVELVRHLLARNPAPFEGEVFHIQANFSFPFEPRRADLPIIIGSTAPIGLRLAGEIAEGAHVAGLMNPDAIAMAQENVAAGASSANRDPAAFDLAASCWTSIGADSAAAKQLVKRLLILRIPLLPAMAAAGGVSEAEAQRIADHVARREFEAATRYVSDAAATAFSFCGDADEAIRRVEEVVGAGVRHIIFKPPLGPDHAEAIRLLGERILPHFRL